MQNQIVCPKCKRVLSGLPAIESAVEGGDHAMGTESILCECGERISYWAITAQLRKQKTFSGKFQKWWRTTFTGAKN